MTEFSVAGVARRWAAATPTRVALRDGERVVTWRELHGRSAQVAQALVADGIGFGDRVAYLGKNGAAFFEVLFGTAMVGAVFVPVNWRLAPPEVVAVVNDAEALVLVADAELAGIPRDAAGCLTTVKRVVTSDYAAWLWPHRADDPLVETSPDDVVMQLYTSGTTGAPKGAMLTNAGVGAFMAYGSRLGIDEGSVVLAAMPLFHIAGSGWALIAMTAGATTVLAREFDAGATLELIGRHRISHSLFVPAMLQALTEVDGVEAADLSSLELVMYGASPISDDLLSRCLMTLDCAFCQTYGLTETSGAVTMVSVEDHRDPARRGRLRAAGKPFGDVELRVVDPETGADLPDGAVGEVWIRSVQVMKGYWRNEEETHRVLTPDGWLRTGDAGYRRDGYLYLHDRLKDMIVSGGENVYPAEVENVLMAHPAVADVAVIGVPSATWGEEVKAMVVPVPGVELDPVALLAFARTELAGYKLPKSVDLVDALPRTPSGKVLKRDLRAPFWAGRERAIG